MPARTGAAHQSVATRGHGTVVADVSVGSKLDTATVQVREQSTNNVIAKLTLKVRDRIGIVEFLEIDNAGRMFVLSENIPTSSNRRASAYVVRYSPNGIQDAVYDIPFSETLSLSRRFIAISPDGDVYFSRTASSEVDLIGVGSRSVHAGDVIDNPSLARISSDQAIKIPKGPIAAVRGLTRQQVVETAFAFESVQWHLSSRGLRSRSGHCLFGFQSDSPAWISGGQAEPGSSQRSLLLGLSRFAESIPRQYRKRHAGRQRLHA